MSGPDLVGSTRVVAPDALAECAAQCHSTARGLIVVGWGNALSSAALDALAEATGWPVLADAISNRRDHADRVRAYEALVRHAPFADAHRPDLVVRFGAPLTSKIVTQWLDASVAQIVVDPHDRRLDPHRAAATVVVADDDRFALDLSAAVAALGGASDAGAWSRSWQQADAAAARALDGVLDLHPTSGAAVVRTVAATAPADAHLLVASSMAVRDLEWFSAPRSDITVHANRGANGIDGLVATALGIAHASARTTIAVLGDLAFLHDAASLHAAPHGTNAVVVVVDNSGGGIFSFLPQADLCDADEFEALFGTPQSVDLVAVAQAHGARARRVDAADLEATLADAARTPGLDVLVVPALGRADDVAVHRAAWAAAADELR